MMKRIVVAAALVMAGTAAAEVSTPRLLADRPAAHCQAPRWAPDGSSLAFDVYNPKEDLREVWLIGFSADGRKQPEEEVTAGRGGASDLLGGKKPPVMDFAWAPNMKLLSKPYVFSSRGPKKNFDLFADGSWLTDNPGNDGQPAWSPDGRYIAYTSQQKDSGDIFVHDIGGDSSPKKVTLWPNATEYGPRWARDKNYLLFVRSQSGTKGQDIGVVLDINRPQDSTRMVTSWDGDEIRPSWAPEGRRIAFYSNRGNANDKVFDLWVINLDGSGAMKLAADVVVDDHQGPVWTPDGTTVLFVQKDFKADNPVRWVRADGSGRGTLPTGTQLNSDLALYDRNGTLLLAFKALGQIGSTEKTWERLYMVAFKLVDLKAEGE